MFIPDIGEVEELTETFEQEQLHTRLALQNNEDGKDDVCFVLIKQKAPGRLPWVPYRTFSSKPTLVTLPWLSKDFTDGLCPIQDDFRKRWNSGEPDGYISRADKEAGKLGVTAPPVSKRYRAEVIVFRKVRGKYVLDTSHGTSGMGHVYLDISNKGFLEWEKHLLGAVEAIEEERGEDFKGNKKAVGLAFLHHPEKPLLMKVVRNADKETDQSQTKFVAMDPYFVDLEAEGLTEFFNEIKMDIAESIRYSSPSEVAAAALAHGVKISPMWQERGYICQTLD